MTAPENAISLTIAGTPDFGSEVLAALYRLTGRSTVELRHAIRDRAPVYTAALFGNDHIQVVPRLEKTFDYLLGLGVPVVVHEWVDGQPEEISTDIMRQIIESTEGQYS